MDFLLKMLIQIADDFLVILPDGRKDAILHAINYQKDTSFRMSFILSNCPSVFSGVIFNKWANSG